ncbi:DUF4920 domain-containing protein [Flavobacterium sp. NST-5]|uniref:DUF4920 domain-containing protein n=1 Tax=Flavobacterium ichthyis TaxID=2698827 RepID=A0ABW9Z5T3_9FLAO|nr:DUF4920 domain-containing protein [Flavobacterium ichthyis]NBL64206.1 DUF4920 domain-containing protein [Flavobacterium ichthyis]
MKKTLFFAVALASFFACADKNKEANSPEEKIESVNDTISRTETDTVVWVKDHASTELKNEKEEDATELKVTASNDLKVDYASFGNKISKEKALTSQQMIDKYKSLKSGDTVSIKFKSKIKSVCKKKGCWMKLELPAANESFVRFKDYGFFVPLNADEGNHEAIVSGKAFLTETTVAELKHYAKDGGKSQAEIDKITQPKFTYAFLADGVLISK